MIPTLNDFIQQQDGTNRALFALALRDFEALREKWLEEASQHALNGNPRRAHYIEALAGA